MNEAGQNFIDESREFLSGKYLPKIEKCIEQLSEEDIWWRAGEDLKNLEPLVMRMPDADERIAMMRRFMKDRAESSAAT